MLNNAEEFKAADEAFARSTKLVKLESYITTVSTKGISDEASAKLKKSLYQGQELA